MFNDGEKLLNDLEDMRLRRLLKASFNAQEHYKQHHNRLAYKHLEGAISSERARVIDNFADFKETTNADWKRVQVHYGTEQTGNVITGHFIIISGHRNEYQEIIQTIEEIFGIERPIDEMQLNPTAPSNPFVTEGYTNYTAATICHILKTIGFTVNELFHHSYQVHEVESQTRVAFAKYRKKSRL